MPIHSSGGGGVGAAGGSDTDVQFNDNGVLNGNGLCTYDKAAGHLNANIVSGDTIEKNGATDGIVKFVSNSLETATSETDYVSPTGVGTLTNKRINPRVQSVANAATITPNADTNDCVDITAIAQAFTIANASGTPVNFQRMVIRIKDNGTPRAITFGSDYTPGGVSLPSITVASKILNLLFSYNTANSLNKWQLLVSAQEA